LLITGGRLGDLYGPRTLFLAGVAVFTAASAGCALAGDPATLIVGRVVQAVGAALLTPQSMSIISHVFPPEHRGRAWGVWGAVAGVAAASGPTIGGVLVDWLGWRGIFAVNVPIGIVAFVFAAAVTPNPRSGERRLDLLGTGLLTTALLLITFGLIEGEPHGWGEIWGPVTIPMIIVAGFAVLAAFLVVQRNRQDREPLLPFAILRDPTFVRMTFIVAVVSATVFCLFFLILNYLQSAVGMTASQAGLTLAVAPVVSVVFAPFSGWLTDRFGGRYVLLAGLVLFAAGMGLLTAALRVDATWRDLAPSLVVFGVGMGVVFAPPGTMAMRDIPPQVTGAAAGVFTTCQRMGTMLGGALVGALLQARLTVSLGDTDGARSAVVERSVDPSVRDGITEAVRVTLLLPLTMTVLAALVTLTIRSGASRAGQHGHAGHRAAEPEEPLARRR
ncbi:MAG: MFS transporter, partial [Pseudonocardiaceae bacterium]|nr:MFS transporter [Pseudonocardiaceae bacterium]